MSKRTTFKDLILLVGLIFGLCTVSYSQEESITITTYYPAPYGVYNELQTNRLYIGTPTQNTDVLWIERADVGDDRSEFRIGIGDNTGGDDSFVIGVIPCSICGGNPEVWNPLFTVRNDGNVGIGTANPGTGLHISGENVAGQAVPAAILIETTFESKLGPALQLWNDGETGGRRFIVLSTGSNNIGGAGLFQIADQTVNQARLSIDANGNVGIGTTTPRDRLGIRGRGAWNNFISFEDAAGTTKWHINFGHPDLSKRGLNFVETGVADYRLFLQEGGNVGIGTAAPVTKFHLEDADPWIVFHDTDEDADLKRWFMGASLYVPGNFVIGKAPDTATDIGSNSDYNRVTITTAGNVGIGTTQPERRLHVISALGGDGVRVQHGDVITDLKASAAGITQGGVGTHTNHPFYIMTNFQDRIYITADGNVGIGTTNPGTHRLYVNGSVYATGGCQGSDIKFKKNITSVDESLSKILQIRGVSFEWDTEEYKEKGFLEGRHYGIIAQEIEEIFPELVREGPEGEKAISYTEIIPILVEAIKAQQQEIRELRQLVNTLIN